MNYFPIKFQNKILRDVEVFKKNVNRLGFFWTPFITYFFNISMRYLISFEWGWKLSRLQAPISDMPWSVSVKHPVWLNLNSISNKKGLIYFNLSFYLKISTQQDRITIPTLLYRSQWGQKLNTAVTSIEPAWQVKRKHQQQ